MCDRDMGVVSRDFAEAGWRRVGSAQASCEVESETKEMGLGCLLLLYDCGSGRN